VKLQGKHVVVVGGSSGIGLAVAQTASAEGARVTIASRSETRLSAAAASIGGAVATVALDVTDVDAVERFFASIELIDHLVCAVRDSEAGLRDQYIAPLVDIDPRAGLIYLKSKFWGQLLVTKYGCARMARTGSITLTSGIASRGWVPGHTVIGPVNCAVEGFVKKAARELGPIRVNAVSPGLTDTPTYDPLPVDVKRALFAEYAERSPLGRTGTPEDIALGYLFLMTATFVTGTVLDVDGGFQVAASVERQEGRIIPAGDPSSRS
jgi:NAD(P)-dependent dehydrogenase (short-subunit alcohol dehydrogenase family)